MLNSPAAKLNQAGAFWETTHNISSILLQDFDLRICQVILIQVGDFFEELEADFWIAVSFTFGWFGKPAI